VSQTKEDSLRKKSEFTIRGGEVRLRSPLLLIARRSRGAGRLIKFQSGSFTSDSSDRTPRNWGTDKRLRKLDVYLGTKACRPVLRGCIIGPKLRALAESR